MKKMEKKEGFSLGLIKNSDSKEALINCILERNKTLHRTAESCSGIFRNEQRKKGLTTEGEYWEGQESVNWVWMTYDFEGWYKAPEKLQMQKQIPRFTF